MPADQPQHPPPLPQAATTSSSSTTTSPASPLQQHAPASSSPRPHLPTRSRTSFHSFASTSLSSHASPTTSTNASAAAAFDVPPLDVPTTPTASASSASSALRPSFSRMRSRGRSITSTDPTSLLPATLESSTSTVSSHQGSPSLLPTTLPYRSRAPTLSLAIPPSTLYPVLEPDTPDKPFGPLGANGSSSTPPNASSSSTRNTSARSNGLVAPSAFVAGLEGGTRGARSRSASLGERRTTDNDVGRQLHRSGGLQRPSPLAKPASPTGAAAGEGGASSSNNLKAGALRKSMTIGRKSSYSTIARQEAHFGPSVGPSSSSSWPHGSSSSSSSSSKPGAVSAASSLVAGTSRRAWDRLNDILRGPESASSTTANSPASPTSREKQRMQRRWGSFSDEEEDTGFPAPSSRGTEYSSASRDDDDDDDHDDRFQDSPRSSSETGSIAGSESSLNLKLASQPHLPLPPSMGRRPTLTFTSPPPTPPFNSTSGGFYGLARGSRSAITLGTPALSSTSLSNYGFPVDHHRHHYTHRPLLDEDNENDVSAAALGGARKVTSAELASLAKGMIPTLCVIGVLFFLSLGIVVGLLRSLPIPPALRSSLPKSTADIQLLSSSIIDYMTESRMGYLHTMLGLGFTGVWTHAWSVPGSVILNILLGALLPSIPAVLFLTVTTTLGGLSSYLLSQPLSPIITLLFPTQLALVRASIASSSVSSMATTTPSTSSAWKRLLIMRATGLVPWSGMNVACGVVGVPWGVFCGTFAAGSLSWNYVTSQVGAILMRVSAINTTTIGPGGISSTDPFTSSTSSFGVVPAPEPESLSSLLRDPALIFKLICLSLLTLLPVLLKSKASPGADGSSSSSIASELQQQPAWWQTMSRAVLARTWGVGLVQRVVGRVWMIALEMFIAGMQFAGLGGVLDKVRLDRSGGIGGGLDGGEMEMREGMLGR